MEGLIISGSLLVIGYCWYTMYNSNKVIPNKPKPVETPKQVEVVDNKPKFSPPFYELEQWIRDNWKKIKVTKRKEVDKIVWEVQSDLVNCEVSLYSYSDWYWSEGIGINQIELNELVRLYRSLLYKRSVKLYEIRQARSRKQLARKLQKLGYGDGTYA